MLSGAGQMFARLFLNIYSVTLMAILKATSGACLTLG